MRGGKKNAGRASGSGPQRRLTVSPEQCRAADDYLGMMPDGPVMRGLELHAMERVLGASWASPQALHGTVQGGHRYAQVVVFEGGRVRRTFCTCPVGTDCKHVAALLQFVYEQGSAAGAGPGAVAPLVAHVEKLAGQGLDEELQLALEGWDARIRSGRPDAHRMDLMSLAKLPPGWSHERVDVWPSDRPPVDVAEGWLWIAQAIRRCGGALCPELAGTVDWEAAEALAGPWVRECAVRSWRERLALASREQERPSGPEFRLRLGEDGGVLEVREPGRPAFVPAKVKQVLHWSSEAQSSVLDPTSALVLQACRCDGYMMPHLGRGGTVLPAALQVLLRSAELRSAVVNAQGEPLRHEPEVLSWHAEPVEESGGRSYEFVLRDAAGRCPPPPWMVLRGRSPLYVTAGAVWAVSADIPTAMDVTERLMIPAEALESTEGLGLLDRLRIPLPAPLSGRVANVAARVVARCRVVRPQWGKSEYLGVSVRADFDGHAPPEVWYQNQWLPLEAPRQRGADRKLVRFERSALGLAEAWLRRMELKAASYARPASGHHWEKRMVARTFPEEFLDWLSARPDGVVVELDRELATLQEGAVSGTVSLDVTESGMDWFDLRVNLTVADVELSPEEVALLLKAPGRWVRFQDRGWRRLEVQLTAEQREQLADLGLTVGGFSAEPQRLHVLQLAGARRTDLLPAEHAALVARRAEELTMRVTPEVPASVRATLRPYQVAGFHFLAYLGANRFGGVLADDMGLGKTLQALTWLAWLRAGSAKRAPVLVVCPKSVLENWRAEAARFCPDFRVRVWDRDTAGDLKGLAKAVDVLVINYAQLRLHEAALAGCAWQAVILDEAQAIKNPASQTAKAACALRADHRLALSGTPIENRLMDLWSLMAFAMPGVLGTRAAFARDFDQKDDPLARRRLAARVRPFLLRRTKREVAPDLPERIEEDLLCTLEGEQAALYRAELKRARAHLLQVKTSRQLDAVRFHLLTSLLRLRQICCHPALVGKADEESAKLGALMDVLEPLMEEGHKVLVFSQFVEMLELIRAQMVSRGWAHFLLTGQTEERGALVESFQAAEGAAVFLISLKAGGFGLNLTAASYVVLFDPWWNPAVEAQAIDRTHRIGQHNTVIAYRLVVKDTIEEKIRQLQRTKGALMQDVLGEENFAQALSMDDFRFLLEGPGAS